MKGDMVLTGKKKLLFVIPSLVCGGAEKILILLLAAMDKDIYETELIVFEQKAVECASYHVNSTVIDLGKKSPLDFFKLIFKLSRVIKERRPNLIISFLTYSNYLTLIAKTISGVDFPAIVAEHSVISNGGSGLTGFVKKLIVKVVYPFATGIVTVSEGCRKELVEKFNVPEKKIQVIPNGVDIESLNRLAQEDVDHPWFKERTPIFVTVGRLSKAKNHQLLLKAFSLIIQKGSYRLAIIGEGEEDNNLRELTRSLGIDQDILFLGYQENPYRFLSKSSVFVLSSSWESFSLAIIEAMCLHVPVISIDCPFGPREIIDDKINGVLVPSGNAEALAQAMIALVSDDYLRKKYADNGFKRVQDFEIVTMINKYVELFNNIIGSSLNSANTSR